MERNVVFNAGFLSIEGEALIRVSTIKGVEVFHNNVNFYLKKRTIAIECDSVEDAKELLNLVSGKLIGELE